MKRSPRIVLLLSGALATTLGPAGCRPIPPSPPPPANGMLVEADQVSADQDQANNSFVPGIGYYHSVDQAYYLYPFNWYDPGFGYYYYGGWQPTPFVGIVPVRSRPTTIVIARIHNSVRSSTSVGTWTPLPHVGSASAPSAGYSATSTRVSSASPSSAGHSTVSTGGFGSSAHAGSASS